VSVVALCSAKGSPGVTSTALALGWVWQEVTGRRVLLVDADMAGSGVAAGYLRCAAPAGGGLLAVAGSRDADLSRSVVEQATPLDDSAQRLLLLGISDPGQAGGLGSLWPRLARAFAAIGGDGIDVLIDLGRLTGRHEASSLLEVADVSVVVIRPTLSSVVPARPLLRDLKARGGAVSVLVVGDRDPYSAAEIGAVLEVGSVVTIAQDADAASVFSAGEPMGWRFPRSALVRSARAVVAQLAGAVTGPAAGAAPVVPVAAEQVLAP
jgi:MinD-like ATPase involved in chromosome partitioning or flagellar assembly